MKRVLVVLTAAALVAAACGGDKTASQEGTPSAGASPASTAASTQHLSQSTPGATSDGAGSDSGKSFASVFKSLFGGALSGGHSGGDLGQGDETLKQYLPANSDLPDGYTPQGQYTFRTPDGISSNGGTSIAAEVATSGEPGSKDLSKLGILAAMVIKPDDLQDLGKVFSSFKDLSKQDLEEALGQAGSGGDTPFGITDVKPLDTSGLGDGAAGFQITIDISALGALFSSLGGDDAPKLDKITMKMYLFARGDYAGAVMRMAFSDSLPSGVDELALAKIIDGKLKSAN